MTHKNGLKAKTERKKQTHTRMTIVAFFSGQQNSIGFRRHIKVHFFRRGNLRAHVDKKGVR